MNLKPQSLIVAIQCVAAQTKLLDDQLDEGQLADAAGIEQLLVSFDLAAEDLKNAYQTARATYDGLPAYESLIA
jgi:hypothetical protein